MINTWLKWLVLAETLAWPRCHECHWHVTCMTFMIDIYYLWQAKVDNKNLLTLQYIFFFRILGNNLVFVKLENQFANIRISICNFIRKYHFLSTLACHTCWNQKRYY